MHDLQEIQFHDLVVFVKRETRKVDYPVYGKEAVIAESSDVAMSRKLVSAGHQKIIRKSSFACVAETSVKQNIIQSPAHMSFDNSRSTSGSNRGIAFCTFVCIVKTTHTLLSFVR